jgi:hypothetical protein
MGWGLRVRSRKRGFRISIFQLPYLLSILASKQAKSLCWLLPVSSHLQARASAQGSASDAGFFTESVRLQPIGHWLA